MKEGGDMNDTNYLNKKKRKKGWIMLGIVLIIVLCGAVVVGIIADKNVKAMNSCVDSVLAILEEHHRMKALDVGKYEDMTIYGLMKFDVEQYEIEELGTLSVMRMNVGLMQMATIVITPRDKNMPLLSADYMYILSKRKCYLEFYDVVTQKDDMYNKLLKELSKMHEEYAHLENVEVSPAWYADLLTVTSYKSGSFGEDVDLEALLLDSLQIYVNHEKGLSRLSEEEQSEKRMITVQYTDNLINKGGISTDVFKKELGEMETKEFFDNVFFGTAVE